jgi:long-chain fatty acid transport protein
MAFVRNILGTGLLVSVCSHSWASGFALSAKSTSSLGQAFSGTTVSADDASVVYSNPALMQSLQGDRFTFLLHSIIAGVQFENDGSNTSGRDNENIDKVHFIPNLYYIKELNSDVRFGFGIYSPFGLGLAYDKDWLGRYHTTESTLRTINFSPAISFSASDKLNLGVGVDMQYLRAELNNAMDFGTICAAYESYGQIPAGTCSAGGLLPQQSDGSQSLKGNNWAMGYSLGLTYDFNQATRMGVTFHSATRHDVRGTSEFDNVPTLLAGTFSDTDAELMLMLPESLNIGVRHALTPRLELLGDYTWTRWSRYDELVVEFDNSLPNSTTEQNWKDVPRYSVGLNYRWKDDWMVRAGASYDITPVPDEKYLSPRVPDTNKLTLALGSKLDLSETLDIDMAVTYTLPSKPDVNNTDGLGHTLEGHYEVDTSYVSVQMNWKL